MSLKNESDENKCMPVVGVCYIKMGLKTAHEEVAKET